MLLFWTVRFSIATIVPVVEVCHIHSCVMTKVTRRIHVLCQGRSFTMVRNSLDIWLREIRLDLLVGSLTFKSSCALLLYLFINIVKEVLEKRNRPVLALILAHLTAYFNHDILHSFAQVCDPFLKKVCVTLNLGLGLLSRR